MAGSEPASAWKESGKLFRENYLSSPDRDSNLDLPVLGSLAQHETSTLANYATEATPEEIETSLDAALKAGYRHIDTAFAYKNEDAIGRVLKKWFDSGKIQRKDLFIVTKLPGTGNHAESVEKYIKLSLSALQMDYVDLYLIHSAVGKKDYDRSPAGSDHQAELDMNTDHVSVWKAMEAQVDAGRAKAIGLSNFNSRQIKRIWSAARIKPANLQVELNVYFQQRELTAFCKALDITVCAYAPLGNPDFAKKISGKSDLKFSSPMEDPVVGRIAKKHNKTPAQVLLRWIIQRGIVVIPKSKTPSRIKANFEVQDFNLTDEDIEDLNALDKGRKGRMFGGHVISGSSHPEFAFNEPY
uniref:NADP-dependent oxidoreductase domain-containing protein n=1 Tax=Timema poppense TaxID=170557 RepID=A0A7R9DHB8_TIMPO|nr:unnamed protein product [Timema poppensis]